MIRRALVSLASLLVVSTAACGPEAPTAGPSRASEPESKRPPAEVSAPLVIFLGDSLTAGFGLAEGQAFPALIGELLRREQRPVRVVNAGVSGDTTAGGLERLDWLLAQRPDVLVVALGANDGLRGLSLQQTRENLGEIIRRSLDAGGRVLLLGMKIPPSYGPEYSGEFERIFEELAREHAVSLMPFLLEGVAAVPELNQADGIHPNAAGQRVLARNVKPYVMDLLN